MAAKFSKSYNKFSYQAILKEIKRKVFLCVFHVIESLYPSSPEICPEMFSYRSQQASLSRAHQYGPCFLIFATRHLLPARSSFPCTCCPQFSGRKLSPPGISEHRKQSVWCLRQEEEMEAQRIVGKRGNGGRVKGRGRRDSDTLLRNEVPGG